MSIFNRRRPTTFDEPTYRTDSKTTITVKADPIPATAVSERNRDRPDSREDVINYLAENIHPAGFSLEFTDEPDVFLITGDKNTWRVEQTRGGLTVARLSPAGLETWTAWYDDSDAYELSRLIPPPEKPFQAQVRTFTDLCTVWNLTAAGGDRRVWQDVMPRIQAFEQNPVGMFVVKVTEPPEDWVFSSVSITTIHRILTMFFPDGPQS